MALKVIKGSEADKIVIKDSLSRRTLNFTDIANNNNKCYSIEIIKAADDNFYLFTNYGRVGGSMCAEYRQCDDKAHAEQETEKIVKSKIKKGYSEIRLISTDIGSEIGKSKVEATVVSELDLKKSGYKIKEENKSSLHPAVQSVVKTWFGSIEQFVIDTLDTSKCALGQLTIEQINKGRDLLLEARQLVKAGAQDLTELNRISSKYYSNIPMNFGYKRLDANQLRFDNDSKLDTAFDVLDTLEGAKDAEKVLTKRSDIDDKYKSLKTEMEWVDPNSDVGRWIDTLFHKTRAKNHSSLGKMRINNIFSLKRDSEYYDYMSMAEKIAKVGGASRDVLPDLLKPIWGQRVRGSKEYELLSDRANILPLFHGTRTQNMPKILASKLLMRKPGFTVAGSMFDFFGGLYFGMSSKSINYSSSAGSIWSGGSDNKGYIFLSDVCLGKQEIAKRAYPYKLEEIKPKMSVWAKGGYSGVINDEFIVYTEQQNWLRYVIEFETNVR